MKNFDFKFYARTQTAVLFSMLVCNHGNVFAQVKAQANNACRQETGCRQL